MITTYFGRKYYIPHCYHYIATDSDGSIHAFTLRPTILGSRWDTYPRCSVYVGNVQQPESINWKLSMRSIL